VCICECIHCGRRNRKGESLFCSASCRDNFASTMPEVISCLLCDADTLGVIDALGSGWRDIEADPEGYSWNYLGFCPGCVRDGGV
jgi:hypothetical protein